jgi:hypothetical protein
MSTKTDPIVVCKELLNTIELKVLQNWAIANAEGDDLTIEEIEEFNSYRASTQGQADYTAIYEAAPTYEELD